MEIDPRTWTQVIHADDLYGACSLKIPDGWEVVKFSTPKNGDAYLSITGGVVEASVNYTGYSPRFILKKIRKVRYVCDDPTLRYPQFGEYIVNNSACSGGFAPFIKVQLPTYHTKCICFRREEYD